MSNLLSNVVVRNMLALYGLQGVNYLAPLILVPYLIRVLGIELYGTWMFAFAFVTIGRIVVSYGFDLTATRQAATCKPQEHEVLSQLLCDITALRFVFWLALTIGLAATISVVPRLAENGSLILIGMTIILSDVFFPVWLFQGREKMIAILLFRAVARTANLVLVFLLVNGPVDVFLVPIIEASAMGVGAVLALLYGKSTFALKWRKPSYRRMCRQVRDGGTVFVALVSVQFYTTVNVIVLGLITGHASVASYSIAERIYSAIRGLLGPFVQAIYPWMSRSYFESRDAFDKQYRRILLRMGGALLFLGGILFVIAVPVTMVLMGEWDEAAVSALRVFACSLAFGYGSFLGPMLVSRGKRKALMWITVFGGCLGLITSPILTFFWGASGAASAFLIVQIYNSVTLMIANNGGLKLPGGLGYRHIR